MAREEYYFMKDIIDKRTNKLVGQSRLIIKSDSYETACSEVDTLIEEQNKKSATHKYTAKFNFK